MNKREKILEQLKVTIPTVRDYVNQNYNDRISDFEVWFLANPDENFLDMRMKWQTESYINDRAVDNVSNFSPENILKLVKEQIEY